MSQHVIYEPFPMRPLADFHEELRFEFLDLPAQLFDFYILKTARQMMKDGNLIRRRAVVAAQPGVTNYKLVSPDGLALCSILDIRHHSRCSCEDHTVPRYFVPPTESMRCSREVAWYDGVEGELHINSRCCHGMYFVHIAVTTENDSCGLPAKIYDDYLPLLMVGVKANILNISGRPWTNINLGTALMKKFKDDLAAATVENATHTMRGGIKMQFGKAL